MESMPENPIADALRHLAIALAVLILAAAAVVFQHAETGAPRAAAGTRPASPPDVQLANESGRGTAGPSAPPSAPALPGRVFHDVPFTSQAPFDDWSDPYGEACEEASVVMAMAWATGQPLAPGRANAEILRLVDFENYHFGYHRDTALRETAKLLAYYYGHRGFVVSYDVGLDAIRRALASGNLVIVPVAGALLQNPYYVGPPPYHMLVIRGYDDAAGEFIVNDPGTRRGEAYRYPYRTLWNAIHDWTGSDDTIMNGPKAMIVVAPARRIAEADGVRPR